MSPRLALTIASLALALTPGCRAESESSESGPAPATTEPAAEAAPTAEPEAVAEAEPAQPAAVLVVAATLDIDGIAYGLTIDDAGNALATTGQGRPAAYYFSPTREPLADTPAALELTTAATTAVPLADGLFAVLLPSEGSVLLARADPADSAAPTLSAAGVITPGGQPADAVVALGMIWVASRQRPGDRGLVGVPLGRGEDTTPTVELLTGPTPIQLAAKRATRPEDERLLALNLREGRGELIVARPPDAPVPPSGDAPGALPEGAVERLAFEGVPLGLVAPTEGDSRVWIRRHDRADLLPVETAGSLAVGAALALPFSPVRVERLSDDALLAVHGDGRIARIDTASGAVTEATLGTGTSAVAVWPDGGLILALDPAEKRAVALDVETLEIVATLPLGHAPGRLVIDAKRARAWVTLPDRQQVLALTLNAR